MGQEREKKQKKRVEEREERENKSERQREGKGERMKRERKGEKTRGVPMSCPRSSGRLAELVAKG